MKRSKTGIEQKDNCRKSWFNGSNIFTMFSSAPPSPERYPDDASVVESGSTRHRSHSLTPVENVPVSPTNPTRPVFKTKSTISSMLSKAKKGKQKENSSSQNSQSSIYEEDANSFLRRDSAKSDATSVSTTDLYSSLTMTHKQQLPSLPNHLKIFKSDEDEAERIQLKNDLVKIAFEGELSLLFNYNDLPSGKILDVGCGPGAWCIDVSTKYPHIQVIGVDNDDMFPSEINLPSNCQLLVCDVLNGLNEFPEASFDVIHIRFMVLSFAVKQYPKVIQNCWRLLKPGGILEIMETDLTIYSPGPTSLKLNQEILEVAQSRELDPKRLVSKMIELMPSEAINTQVKYRSIPMGLWGGRIGVLCRDDMVNMLTKFQPAIKDFYQREKTSNFDRDLATVIREMENYKSFSNYYFYSAQKSYNDINTTTTTNITNTTSSSSSSNNMSFTTTTTDHPHNTNNFTRNPFHAAFNPKSF